MFFRHSVVMLLLLAVAGFAATGADALALGRMWGKRAGNTTAAQGQGRGGGGWGQGLVRYVSYRDDEEVASAAVAEHARPLRVAIIGAGRMGQIMAAWLALNGATVRLHDRTEHLREAAQRSVMVEIRQAMMELDGLSAEQSSALQKAANARVSAFPTDRTPKSACAGVDIVLEAVPEEWPIKIAVLQEVIRYAPAHAVLTTNSANFLPEQLALHAGVPADRVWGVRFLHPVTLIKDVEVATLNKGLFAKIRGLLTRANLDAFQFKDYDVSEPEWDRYRRMHTASFEQMFAKSGHREWNVRCQNGLPWNVVERKWGAYINHQVPYVQRDFVNMVLQTKPWQWGPSAAPTSDATQQECVVCMAEMATVMFNPCKHMITCAGCARDQRLVTCPECRSEITQRLQVHD